MTADSAHPREAPPRVLLGTSVLLVMLLSLPVAAGVRAPVAPAVAATMGMAPGHALPGVIASRLCAGIRLELPDQRPDRPIQGVVTPRPQDLPVLAGPALREALLDLPPPARA